MPELNHLARICGFIGRQADFQAPDGVGIVGADLRGITCLHRFEEGAVLSPVRILSRISLPVHTSCQVGNAGILDDAVWPRHVESIPMDLQKEVRGKKP